MGNKQCCQVDNKQYEATYSEQHPDHKITAIKIQTNQSAPEQIITPPPHIQNHLPKQAANEALQIKIEVAEEQQTTPLPQLSHQVQNTLQQYNQLNQQIQSHKYIKSFGKQVYLGQIDKQKVIPQGQGKIYKTDGSIYLGQWNQGKAHGKGVYIKKNGSYYEGQFNFNNAHGKGKFVSNSLTYQGGFKNNKFDGEAVEKGKDYSFEGHFRAGYKLEGLLIWKAGQQQYQYRGQFNQKNQFHGQGVLKQPKGIYEGVFKDGQKHGKGVYKFENGLRYVGEYNQGKKRGKGIIYNCNETIAYEGEFDDDLPHGQGFIFDQKGKKNKRKWVKGIDVEGL